MDYVILAFLAYAPWYGAEILGSRTHVPFLFSQDVTRVGLYNFLWISVLSTILLFIFAQSWRQKAKISFLEVAILFMPVAAILHHGPLTKDYFIGVENMIFMSVCFLALLNRDLLYRRQSDEMRKIAPYILPLSYVLALMLPQFIRPGALEPFSYFGAHLRFRGWLGLPTFIGFLGLTVSAVGMMLFYKVKKENRCYAFFFAVVGIMGSYFAVHRISMFAATIMYFVQAFQSWHQKDKTYTRTFVALGLMVFALQFVGETGAKYEFLNSQRAREGRAEMAELMSKNNIILSGSDRVIMKKGLKMLVILDKAVQTNGRIPMWISLLVHSWDNLWFGSGTGEAANYVMSIGHVFGGQPHSDYVRILVDYGFIGLLYFVLVGLMLLREVRGTPYFAMLVAFAISLATDNLFVYPICGYGALFLGTVILNAQAKPPST